MRRVLAPSSLKCLRSTSTSEFGKCIDIWMMQSFESFAIRVERKNFCVVYSFLFSLLFMPMMETTAVLQESTGRFWRGTPCPTFEDSHSYEWSNDMHLHRKGEHCIHSVYSCFTMSTGGRVWSSSPITIVNLISITVTLINLRHSLCVWGNVIVQK